MTQYDFTSHKICVTINKRAEKNVWTHIVSLKREDASRLGYDNAKAWRDLIRAHRNDIAATMNIPPNDFRWCAAFLNEGEHPRQYSQPAH